MKQRSIDDAYFLIDYNLISLDSLIFDDPPAVALRDAADHAAREPNGVAGDGLPGWAKDLAIGFAGEEGGAKGGPGKGGGGGGGGGGGKPDKPGKPPKDDPPPEEDPPTDPPPPGEVMDSYTSGDAGAFNIEIIFVGTLWTYDLQQTFVAASELLSDIIVGDVADVNHSLVGGFVDDVRIDAELATIDGVGNVLGQAGPRYYRTDSNLPITGEMTFDVADADNLFGLGLFDDVVFHEMMHVLGFGTMWEAMGLVVDYNGDLRFTGDAATAAYLAEYSAKAATDPNAGLGVPVETDGGPGTAGGHWDEATFDNEIMTGYIDDPNLLSDMTVAALEDMGYQLSAGAYDVEYLA